MTTRFTATRLVEFRDTDAAGILHFSAYFAYMESVEHEFLRGLGLSVLMRDEHHGLSWPRVSAHCDYAAAVRFEDELAISLAISRLGAKSVTYEFQFRCREQLVATGRVTAVCCRMDADGPRSTPIPGAVGELLQPYVVAADAS